MNCPRCGGKTEGSYSQGGILWALCEDCMNNDQEKINRELEAFICWDRTKEKREKSNQI